MDQTEHNFFVDWIVADAIPFSFSGNYYLIRSPSREAKVIANDFFFEFYYKSIEEGVLDEGGVYKLLGKYGIWGNDKDAQLKTLYKEVDDIKVAIFESYLDSGKRNKMKAVLRDTRDGIEKLQREKQTFDYLGAEFIANYAKYQVLLGYSIYKGKQPLWKTLKRWELPDNMAVAINNKLNKYKLNSEQYRELAVSDYWRSIYNIRRGNIFGKPIVDYSDHQRHLISWSQTYENVYKSPDCPPDQIINDFDAIDGWFIVQKRKRDRQLNNSTIEETIGNEKIRNSEYVFVVADEEDISKVYEMNDTAGKIALHQRLAQIKRSDVVSEINMIDKRQLIQQQAFEMRRGA